MFFLKINVNAPAYGPWSLASFRISLFKTLQFYEKKNVIIMIIITIRESKLCK